MSGSQPTGTLQTLADRLRWARTQSGLSQAQVAEKFGWHRPTVSQIEAGQRQVKSQELDAFAKLYDVKLQWLADGDDGIESNPQIEVAARELAKLSEKDLGTLLRVIKVLRSGGES
ncbi:helix-turn-helix domain-containing protein [Rhodopirellula bahusiensis]|uniref:helix-turn-helix domain-containing protein n=1 Tax=Rhodopirellula bahusiensis TaxID=2014065 RepID=UPI003265EA18